MGINLSKALAGNAARIHQLARETNIPRSTLYKYRAGSALPTPERMDKLSTALRMKPAQFLFGG